MDLWTMIVAVVAVGVGYMLFGPSKKSRVLKSAPPSSPNELSDYSKEEGPFFSTKKDAEKRVFYAKEGPASLKALSIPEYLIKAAAQHGNRPALRIERPTPQFVEGKPCPPSLPRDEWKTWTYNDYVGVSKQSAKACMANGVEQFDSVAVWGHNSPEWFFASTGSIFCGAKTAGIYPTDQPETIAFKIDHSDSKVVVLEDNRKLAALGGVIDGCPLLNTIVIWGEAPSTTEIKRKNGTAVPVKSWDAFMADAAKVSDGELEERMKKIKAGHCCTLIYTSGTTGNPKAVMVSHDNIAFEAASVLGMVSDVMGADDAHDERILSYLPLSHVAGMMVDIICPIINTANNASWFTVYFARPYDQGKGTLGDRLRAVQPTMFLGVPRVWEKISEKMKAMGANAKGLKKAIATFAKGKGIAHAHNCQLGGSGEYPSMYGIAEKVVLSKVKKALGLDCCKFAFTGAAPITVPTLEYFGALGIQINEVYGMSECTGATTWSLDEAHIWGSCGFASKGTEVKVFKCDEKDSNIKKECPRANDMFQATDAEQGEICFRGRHIMMGYLANPRLGKEHIEETEKKNAEAIDKEGWLHSGDKGCMSAEGMVKITGRFKELIIGAGGENIAPVPIEDNITKLCPLIKNIMMVGDKRKFNTALIVLKCKDQTNELPGTDELLPQTVDPSAKTVADAIKSKAIIKAIQDAIIATNNNGKCCPSPPARIQRFTIISPDFSVETGELTNTLKLKRSEVDKKHKALIDKMYDANMGKEMHFIA